MRSPFHHLIRLGVAVLAIVALLLPLHPGHCAHHGHADDGHGDERTDLTFHICACSCHDAVAPLAIQPVAQVMAPSRPMRPVDALIPDDPAFAPEPPPDIRI